ncbi:MAG: hypothetical protein O3B13_06785 [Planctomycetota bacterium]|nr:hypothetical protein [Planctomycetota bacterium]MDA1162789.1 hypothetical protein [Planctomycetota bacterium]
MRSTYETASVSGRSVQGQARLRFSNCRRGTVLVVFMVSLLLLSLTVAAMTRVMLMQRSLVRSNELRVQSEWLFQSAVARAATQIRSDAAYKGEEWRIPAESLGQPFGAVATISVEAAKEETKERRVAITLLYPPDEAIRAMVSRTISVSL